MTKPHESKPRDPGAYIGIEPELASETIPGGVRPDDERVAAHSSQAGPTQSTDPPGAATEDHRREAGQDR
jgi:hypothetical protein